MQEKELYIVPESRVVITRTAGIVCASGEKVRWTGGYDEENEQS